MSEPITIPPEQLERFARELGLSQAIFVGWCADGRGITHVITWGDSLTDSAQAAQGGNAIKRALGYPEALCRVLSPRVAEVLGRAAHGGYTCAEAEQGTDVMAAGVSRLREERNAALRAYDAEVTGRRDEVTRLLTELRGEREKYRQVVEINHANQRSYWAETDKVRAEADKLRAELDARAPGAAEEWVCITCEERNVTRCDEDRCCKQCGMDLSERRELLSFLLAPAPAPGQTGGV